ncbi:unnamed protein product [Schistosoma curassoni]|uniref:Uncharacterized protein n=1 Tax=Schistosoma curassoni TaxID=6186 RepID=A0A183JFW6_9TREM|nr:unnamed protein product [Schistosoma curassoni]
MFHSDLMLISFVQVKLVQPHTKKLHLIVEYPMQSKIMADVFPNLMAVAVTALLNK